MCKKNLSVLFRLLAWTPCFLQFLRDCLFLNSVPRNLRLILWVHLKAGCFFHSLSPILTLIEMTRGRRRFYILVLNCTEIRKIKKDLKANFWNIFSKVWDRCLTPSKRTVISIQRVWMFTQSLLGRWKTMQPYLVSVYGSKFIMW